MPLRIRWSSKEYIGIALILLGACGMFQVLIIFIAQYFLSVGNHVVVIIIPIGVTLALYYGTLIAYESFAQVQRRENLKSQFKKSRIKNPKLRKLLDVPITKPLIIMFVIFSISFTVAYFISTFFVNNSYSFIIAELAGTIICLIAANSLEKNYAKVQRI